MDKIITGVAIVVYSAFCFWFKGFIDRLVIKLDLSLVDNLFVTLVGAALVFRGGMWVGEKLP